ncbi:MAG: iron uptake porin [Coleofasciculaceae cyanobacterium SM2_3_26]|nr:iron uptake porin [Coleofasciculaceae cyanobacterium SM2_3_26]
MVKPTNVWKLLWNVPKTAWVLPVCLAWLAGVSPQAIALEGEPEAPQVENSSAENTLAENTLETSSQEAGNVTDVAALSPESSHEVDAQPSLAEREDAIARETLRERETVERVTDEIASDRLGELAENTPDYMQQVNSVSDPAVNLEQLENPMNDLGQVNSVNQLTDISPSDWAYQAVKSMVERYQCLEGYPDQTFRGNRPVTRFEFAAALNACLDRVLELVGTDPDEEIDLTTIQRLLEEFQAELSNLDGRIEDLEARAAQLEANQFSTTTKLSGLVTFNVTDVFGDDDIVAEGFGPFPGQAFRELDGEPLLRSGGSTNTTFSGLVWLTLNTSFSGRDNLTTLLAVSNGTSPINNLVSAGLFNTVGTPFFDQTAGVNPNEVIVRTLQYSFPVTDFLSLTIGPRINWYIFFDFNPYANIINGTGSFNGSGGAIFNNPNRGAGAVAQFDLGDKLSFNVGYLVENDEFLPPLVPLPIPKKACSDAPTTSPPNSPSALAAMRIFACCTSAPTLVRSTTSCR